MDKDLDIAQLAPEEAAILEILIRGKLAREQVPIPDRAIVGSSGKYGFPIGVDAEGHAFPIPEQLRDHDEA